MSFLVCFALLHNYGSSIFCLLPNLIKIFTLQQYYYSFGICYAYYHSFILYTHFRILLICYALTQISNSHAIVPSMPACRALNSSGSRRSCIPRAPIVNASSSLVSFQHSYTLVYCLLLSIMQVIASNNSIH